MSPEYLLLATVESSALLLVIWLAFRILPATPANWKAWIWRLGFLKVALGFLPLASVTLHVLPAQAKNQVLSKPMEAVQVFVDEADTSPMVSPRGKVLLPPPPAPGTRPDPWLVLWAVGAGVTFAFGLFGRIRAGVIVRRAAPVTDSVVFGIFGELCGRVGAHVRLVTSKDVEGAMLVGGLPPAIVLPGPGGPSLRLRALQAQDGWFCGTNQPSRNVGTNQTTGTTCGAPETDDVRLMLAHEVAHLVRKDLFWYGAMWTVQALLFFNPIVWVAARCARQDHESATDLLAIELAEAPVQTYADMLLRTTVVSRMSLVPGALSMAESFRNVHQRLRVMKHFHRKPSLWIKSSALALALISVLSIPTYVPAASLRSQQSGDRSQGGQNLGSHSSGSVIVESSSMQETKVGNYVLDFKQADVRTALRLVAKKTNIKFDIDPRLQGRVTLHLQNVTQKVAIENILRQVGATYVEKNGVYKITAPPAGRLPKVASRIARGTGTDNIFLLDRTSGTVLTGNCKDVDVRKVLKHLFEATQKSFDIDPNVQGNVSISVKDISFDAAFAVIAKQAGAKVEVRNGEYFVVPASVSARAPRVRKPGADDDLVTIKYEGTDVRTVVRDLARHHLKSFRMEGNVQGIVTLSLMNVTFDIALKNVLRQVNATFDVKDGVYLVHLAPAPANVPPLNSQPVHVANPDGGLVSFEYESANVRDVLLALFKRTQKSFNIDTDVQGFISISCKNMPFDIALGNVVRQVNGSFVVKGGVYEISGKP